MAARREPGGRAAQLFDRTPPQSIDAERSVLGAMLLNPDAVGAGIEVLHESGEDVFYVSAHQKIYDGIVALFRSDKPVDIVTLQEQLTRAKTLEAVGGVSYIAELSEAVPTSANIEHYARIVLEAALLRRIISTCSRVVGEAYEAREDVADVLDRAERDIFSIAEQRQVNPIHRVADLLEAAIQRIEAQMRSKGISGLPTGMAKLDEMLSGLQPSDMVILAARPSVGKTAFSLNIASHLAAREGKGVLIFSLEMAKEQLVQRLVCMEGEVDAQRLRSGYLAHAEYPKLQRGYDVLHRAPIYIDDTPNISVLELRSKARRHAAQNPVDMVVIDYLQLMTGGGGRSESRQVEIAEISRAVKGLARELRVPVLALSQLSREAEKDDTGSPKLSHLRESGAIEQDADVVLMLSRPPAHEAEGRDNLIRVTVAKQRNGPTGFCDLLFEKNIQRFRNLDGTAEAYAPPESSFDADFDVANYEDDDIPFEDDETPF